MPNTMTDREAIRVLSAADGVPTRDLFCKAVAVAANRLIQCQWHDYQHNNPALSRTMYGVLLDVEYPDGSSGTSFGHVGINGKGELYCKLDHENTYTKDIIIRRWMKPPEYEDK